jgi:hypothetical protein
MTIRQQISHMSTTPIPRRTQQLPLVPEDRRGYVQAFAKSALFCVGGKNERTRHESRTIATWPDAKLEYTGIELRDDDEDVLIGLFHKARGMGWDGREGLQIDFSGYDFLGDIEWKPTKAYYVKLRDCLNRLQGGSITLKRVIDGRVLRHRCQLIRKFSEVQVEGARFPRWQVWIEPEMAELFASEQTRYELIWSSRSVLSKSISKWLHSFISAAHTDHDQWFVISEAQLFPLTGSKAAEPRTTRALVKSGLEEMASKNVIAEWKIHKEFVYVAMKPGLDINRATAAATQRMQNVLAFDGEAIEVATA